MGRGMIPVPSVPIRIGFLLLVLVVIIHDLVVGVIILTILRAAGNIEKLETSYVNTLNVYDILKVGKIILTKDALKGVEEVYA